MYRARRYRGFTLVELLVVIGIIALLISVLLPALNKARQSANSINCAANLRSIGQLLNQYAAENRGFLPPAVETWQTDGSAGWHNPGPNGSPDANPQNSEYSENARTAAWEDILTLMVKKTTIQDVAGATGNGTGIYAAYTNLANCGNMASDFLGVFHDSDIPDVSMLPRVSNYYCNMRLIPPCNDRDRAVNGGNPDANGLYTFFHLRNQGSIANSSEVMMLWDAPVNLTDKPGFICRARYDDASVSLDNYVYTAATTGHMYVFPMSVSNNAYSGYSNRLGIAGDSTQCSWPSGTVTTTGLVADNVDNPSLAPFNAMRFRHMANTSMNACFADGHVESRVLGSVTAHDVCVNFK